MSTSSARKVLEPLHEVYGVDVSDDALRKADAPSTTRSAAS